VPVAGAHRVRIIGGRCRGRPVRFPSVEGLRPTPDRVRETLFNWLGQDLTGRVTLDPFAGSGILTLEALSRGAARAVAVDRDPRAIASLQRHAEAFGLTGLEAHRAEASAYLAHEPRRFDVIFLDPPFSSDEWEGLLAAARPRLAAEGVIYAEAPRPLGGEAGLRLVRSGRAGQVYYHLLAC
jgi:16S rRNA (guanine966-N2)-methyltransferase